MTHVITSRLVGFAKICLCFMFFTDMSRYTVLANETTTPKVATTTTSAINENVCDGIACPGRRYCAVNEQTRPTCVCSAYCWSYFPSILCGTDNKTYGSNCELQRAACISNSNITVSYYGTCKSRSLCDGIVCPDGRRCAVGLNGVPTCICNDSCGHLYDPVCGKDNITYVNDCELQRKSCATNKPNTVAYRGQCKRESLCDTIKCDSGRFCAIDRQNLPRCVCNETCSFEFNPVCGSDGVTYGSTCDLKRRACLSSTNITVTSVGICYKGTACDNVKCPDGQICYVDEKNRPVCVCNQNCYYNYDPVCGSDGKTYTNKCYLERQSCMAKSNVTVSYKGKCYKEILCSGVTCPLNKLCEVNADNSTTCVCNENCGTYYNPVCGSDNKTYDNYCNMLATACKTNTSINMTSYGVCNVGLACKGVSCAYGKHCEVDNMNQASCVCNTVCPKIYDPICGSDNKTYANQCELDKKSCMTNNTITWKYRGRCEDGPGCSSSNCPIDRTCIVDERNRPSCICSPYCSADYRPVCGSDRKTYTNQCLLNLAACFSNKNISVVRQGPCRDPCARVTCPTGRYCGNFGILPACVCIENCYTYYSPVCGMDGITYLNDCELQKKSCLSRRSITMAYKGRCVDPVCVNITCSAGRQCAVNEQNRPVCVCSEKDCYPIYIDTHKIIPRPMSKPVCGTDNKTYSNNCEVQQVACTTNRNITVARNESCTRGSACDGVNCTTGRYCALDSRNRPTCVCSEVCTMEYNPVCGSDGKTYGNLCDLGRQACLNGKNITMIHSGPCVTVP